nr:MAG TPA: Helix-turn-helix XRE-family like protein [Caudoviricetes sp.]
MLTMWVHVYYNSIRRFWEDYDMTIGQRIKVRREELNMSQEELAKRIGYKSRSSINKIELDLYSLQPSKIKTIADALDTTPSYIMGWDEEASRNEWASKFRDSVMQILNNADSADLEAAGISVQEIEEELSGSEPISLVAACSIADQLGESLDSLLGHTPKEMIKAALQQEDGQTAEIAEIIELLLDLPADRRQEALNYLRYLSERADK